jgi:hypothetical protein
MTTHNPALYPEPEIHMSIMCKKCRQAFRPDRILRIELRGPEVPDPMILRLSDTPGNPNAGLHVDGSAGCPACLDAATIISWLIEHLANASPVPWETAHVVWKMKGELAGVPRAALIGVPPAVKPRTVGTVGDLTLLAALTVEGLPVDYIVLAGDPDVKPVEKSRLIVPEHVKAKPEHQPQHQVWALRFEIPGVREGLSDKSLILALLDRLAHAPTPNSAAIECLGSALAALNVEADDAP